MRIKNRITSKGVAELDSTGQWTALQKVADAAGITLEMPKAVKPKAVPAIVKTAPATAIPPLDKGYTEWLHKQSR